jgi:myo-inositol-1-phosphate synthase
VAAAAAGSDGPGVAHPRLGGYGVEDLTFVAAFDVDERKVGQDLAAAISSEPNCTTRYAEVPVTGTLVSCGPLADGVSALTSPLIRVAKTAHTVTFDDVGSVLKAAAPDVLICYLPVGAKAATIGYAEAALAAGVAFVNCNPEPIASDAEWQQRFAASGIPVLGDDIKSQLGATTLHRTLIDMCRSRGAVIDQTYQLNVGGNTDFLNMLDPSRSASKRASKVAALQACLSDVTLVAAGPSDYVPHLSDRKVAYIKLEGRSMLGMPFVIEAKLEVEDSPNSAGVAVDALRAAKIAADRGIGGPVDGACALLFKTPPVSCADAEAAAQFSMFVDNA